jgi:uncharacterized protein YwqG
LPGPKTAGTAPEVMKTGQQRKRVRGSFPQVYRYPKAGMTYWEVSARSKYWGLNERRNFNSEKAALDYAEQIAEQIKLSDHIKNPKRPFPS